MSTAASGMKAQQTNIDTIANNLANVNTAGFKRSQAEFQDLLYEITATGGTLRGEGRVSPARIEIGHGVKLVGTNKDFTHGSIVSTENPLDLMIEGDGFFQVRLPDDTIAYTRDGSFKLDAERNIVTSAGYRLEPPVTLPLDAVEVSISREGVISVRLQGESSTVDEVGQIELTRFPNAAGMSARGGNLYLESPASGQPLLGLPGLDGMGEISSGYLEMSNVDTVHELVNMIAAQRAYELNSRTIAIADEMLQTVNRLKS
jgi:flagellar basal-body rod protein FlgG